MHLKTSFKLMTFGLLEILQKACAKRKAHYLKKNENDIH